MKNIITLLFLLITINVYPQKKDFYSENIDSVINVKIETSIKPYVLKIDSLTNQIDKYKLNENYYTTALSSQTAIFSLIVTLLVLLIGYFTFSKFKSEVRDVKEKYEDSVANYNKTNELLKEIDGDLYTTMGIIHVKADLIAESVKFFIRGLSNSSLKTISKPSLLDNIEILIKMINVKINSEENIKELLKDKEEIIKYLNEIKFDDNDLLTGVSKLRISLTEKMNNA